MPIFRRANIPGTDEFVTACSADDVSEDEMTTVKVGSRKLILIRHNSRVYAIDSLCPHAAADLTKGSIRAWQICCHEHDYCFDIRTGRIVWPEDEVYRLRRYEVKEEEGKILVRLALLR